MRSNPRNLPIAYEGMDEFMREAELGKLSDREIEEGLSMLQAMTTVVVMESVIASYLAEAMRVLCRKETR